jgi:hypothetical protein
MASHSTRRKLSTTVAPETQAYLDRMVKEGRAASLAEAVDRTVARARKLDNRRRLEAATAAYFANMSDEEGAEENRIGNSMASVVDEVDFDA